jgi:hypothetical protein
VKEEINAKLNQELEEELDYEGEEEGEWAEDDGDEAYEQGGEENVEDGEVAPMDGDSEEGFPPEEVDGVDSTDEEASSTKAVCCKCGKEASNGQTVYSCSTGGSCRKCKKYGGQKRAEKVAAPSACAKGGKGAHSACKKAFGA